MGEAFLVKSLGFKPYDPLDDVVIAEGRCSILAKVVDSEGNFIANCKVNCKDGSTWYNYTTNDQGTALFQCNSGAANITASNYGSDFRIFDQQPNTVNIDAPVGTKFSIDIPLAKCTSFSEISGSHTGIFRVSDNISNLNVVGGGGGGSPGNYYSYHDYSGGWSEYWSRGGGGGGGGSRNFSSSVVVARNQNYTFTIGSGGETNLSRFCGYAGGTSSAFELSALGGSGASYCIGGNGGIGLYNGGKGGNGYNNTSGRLYWSNETGYDGTNGAGGGGGGGSMITGTYCLGGSNGGRWGGGFELSAYSMANNGSGGGGGGGGVPNSSWYYEGSTWSTSSGSTDGCTGCTGRVTFDI